MSKRHRKVKKSGSTARNIHKIAATIGMVPLVSMSSFLFHDSYALACGPMSTPIPISTLHNVTIDLSSSHYTEIDADYLFGSGSGYSLSTPLLNLASTSALSANFYYGTYNTVALNGKLSGTYTVTVGATKSGVIYDASFKVVVFDPVLTAYALDLGHNGFDIGDVAAAIKNQSVEADLNANGVVDSSDITRLLEFIPPGYTNHNPTATTIPDITLVENHGAVSINLDNYFSDQDGDELVYRLSSEGTSVTACFDGSLYLSDNELGTTNFTVVADDQHGGSSILKFSATVISNSAPTVVWHNNTELAISSDVTMDMDQMFTDADSDSLVYILSTASMDKFNANFDDNELHLSYASGTGIFPLTITADDLHGGTVSNEINAEVIYEEIIVGSTTSLNVTDFLAGSTTHAIIAASVSTPLASSSFQTLTSPSITNLNITGISKGTYTVTISATTGATTKYKTFILPVVTGGV